jgi:hypothetical protein
MQVPQHVMQEGDRGRWGRCDSAVDPHATPLRPGATDVSSIDGRVGKEKIFSAEPPRRAMSLGIGKKKKKTLLHRW